MVWLLNQGHLGLISPVIDNYATSDGLLNLHPPHLLHLKDGEITVMLQRHSKGCFGFINSTSIY